jgi:AcrR family transcriptional regulator
MTKVSKPEAAPTVDPKTTLVERAVDYFCEHGLSDISLRELAAGIGTSHRMLIYHFGSKEELLVEVAHQTERRQLQALEGLFDSDQGSITEVAMTFWRRIRSAELAPLERLFFELYGQGLQGRPFAIRFLDGIVDSWVGWLGPVLVAAGLDHQRARAVARLGLAVVRGLLLDVLATGNEAEVDAAFELHIAALEALQASALRRS